VKFARALTAVAGLTLITAFGCQDNTPKSSAPPETSLSQIAPDQTASAAQPVTYDQPVAAAPVDTMTPAPTDPTTPVASDDAGGGSDQRYTIKAGDTLYRIAATHYGTGRDWKKIVEANPGIDPSRLRVGQTIVLP